MSERSDEFDVFAKSFRQADLFGLFGLIHSPFTSAYRWTWLEIGSASGGTDQCRRCDLKIP